MTLDKDSDSNNSQNNVEVTNTVETQSIINNKSNTKTFFKELREDRLAQKGAKEDIKLILKCIGDMQKELTKTSLISDDNAQDNLARANEYEDFYNEVLKELEE